MKRDVDQSRRLYRQNPTDQDRQVMTEAQPIPVPHGSCDPWTEAAPMLLRLSACSDRDEGEAVADALTRMLGFDYFSYVVSTFPAGADGRNASGLLMTSYPAEWRDRYRRQAYEVEDPVFIDGRRARDPFHWRGEQDGERITRHARQMYQEAGTFGICNGYTVPVRGPDGDCGLFSVSGSNPPADARSVAGPTYRALLVLAQLVHGNATAHRLSARPRMVVDLSYHERVCLSWASRGKTAQEIAIILGRSKATIDFHFRRASTKLDAVNKVQAVTRALALNLI